MEHNLFVSYPVEDTDTIKSYISFLEAGFSKIYDRYNENRTLSIQHTGIHIAEADATLLFWSKNSRHSHLQAFECQTTLAMGKRVFICLMDDTPLPNRLINLASFDHEELVEDADGIANFILDDLTPGIQERVFQITGILHTFNTENDATLSHQAKSFYERMGWLKKM